MEEHPCPPAEWAQWQTHRKMSGFMCRVLAFTLVNMPAYADLKLEVPSDGLWPDLDCLQEWSKSQLPDGLFVPWNAHWVAPVREAQTKERGYCVRADQGSAHRMPRGAAWQHQQQDC